MNKNKYNKDERNRQSAVGFVDFPFRAINLHCANVVVLFFIKIYNIYCHKPDVDYNIWSSACSRTPRSPKYVATCTRNANAQHKRKERKPAKLWESAKARCVIVYTQNRYQIQGLRLTLVFIRLTLSLASLPLSFLFVFVFLVGAGSDCDCTCASTAASI